MFNLFEFNKSSIIMEDNPILREKSKEVELPLNSANQSLVKKLVRYVIDSNDEEISKKKHLVSALGLAAIQVGIRLRIFVMIDVVTEESIVVINPVVKKSSKEKAYLGSGEGCLSVEDKIDGYVHRSLEIDVEYYNELSERVSKTYKGMQAIVFQHEFDHLEGILYTDYLKDDPFKMEEGSLEI